MRLVKIDGINVLINMDNVVQMSWAEEPDFYGHYSFKINGELTGYFEDRYERDRIIQGIYEKFGSPDKCIYFDNRGYEVNNNKDRELWV